MVLELTTVQQLIESRANTDSRILAIGGSSACQDGATRVVEGVRPAQSGPWPGCQLRPQIIFGRETRAKTTRHMQAADAEEVADAEWQAAEPVLVATLPSDLSATEYACIDLCAETNKEWPAENVCVWYRRCPGAATEVFAVQEACPHARISLRESDIEDFRSTDLGTSLQGPCIACPAHAYVFDAGSGRCLTNPSTPDARRHSARWNTWPPDYLCPLICSAAFPFDGSRATRGPACRAAAQNPAILAGTRRGLRRHQNTSKSS